MVRDGVPSRELTYPPKMAYLKMIFLFPRWDMLISRRVIFFKMGWWETTNQSNLKKMDPPMLARWPAREIPISRKPRRMWRPSRRLCREHPGVKLPCRCGSWSTKVCRKMSLGGYPGTLVGFSPGVEGGEKDRFAKFVSKKPRIQG